MQVHPQDVAAFILEPVLGEGGFLTPPPGFMKALRQLADKHGIMIIADEVRSCSYFACGGGGLGMVYFFGGRGRRGRQCVQLGFMQALRQVADKHGIMIIADEVRRAGGGASWCVFWGLGRGRG